MFLRNGFKGENNFWRYFVTILIVFFATQFGSIPFFVIMLYKTMEAGIAPDRENLLDFSAVGLDSNLGLFLLLLPFVIGLITLLILIKHLHKKKIIDVLSARNKIDWSRIFFSAGVWLVLLVVINSIHYFHNPGNYVFHLDLKTFIPLVIIVLTFIPMQSSFEEISFRGYLMQGLAVAFKYKWIALLIPTVLFAALHVFNPEIKEYGFALAMPQYLIMGLMLGIITILDDGLESALGVHAVNNIFLAIFITHKSSALQTPALLTIKQINPALDLFELAIATFIFLLIVGKKYNWKWNKLFGKVT